MGVPCRAVEPVERVDPRVGVIAIRSEIRMLVYVYRSPVTPGYRKTVETGLVRGNVRW